MVKLGGYPRGYLTIQPPGFPPKGVALAMLAGPYHPGDDPGDARLTRVSPFVTLFVTCRVTGYDIARLYRGERLREYRGWTIVYTPGRSFRRHSGRNRRVFHLAEQ